MDSVFAGDSLFLALNDKLLEKRAEGSLSDLKTRYGADYLRVAQFINNLERAIALTMGIRFAIQLPDKTIAQGEPINARLEFYNGSAQTQLIAFHFEGVRQVSHHDTYLETRLLHRRVRRSPDYDSAPHSRGDEWWPPPPLPAIRVEP